MRCGGWSSTTVSTDRIHRRLAGGRESWAPPRPASWRDGPLSSGRHRHGDGMVPWTSRTLPLAPRNPLPFRQRLAAVKSYHTGTEVLRDAGGPVTRIVLGPRWLMPPIVLATSPQAIRDILTVKDGSVDKTTPRAGGASRHPGRQPGQPAAQRVAAATAHPPAGVHQATRQPVRRAHDRSRRIGLRAVASTAPRSTSTPQCPRSDLACAGALGARTRPRRPRRRRSTNRSTSRSATRWPVRCARCAHPAGCRHRRGAAPARPPPRCIALPTTALPGLPRRPEHTTRRWFRR